MGCFLKNNKTSPIHSQLYVYYMLINISQDWAMSLSPMSEVIPVTMAKVSCSCSCKNLSPTKDFEKKSPSNSRVQHCDSL